jgi:hypothetical protein
MVRGVGFQGSEFRVWGFEFLMVQSQGFTVQGPEHLDMRQAFHSGKQVDLSEGDDRWQPGSSQEAT